jgi:arginase family enzyme
MSAAVVGLLCRTSDRSAGGARGVETLAPLVGKRLGREPRLIGTPGEPREARFEEDLRDSRGCLLEAGGQVEDALTGGNTPVVLAGDCSVCMTTLPAALRERPEAKVLWLDAHGDFNTPETTPSGFLGGMALAGACGQWETGLAEPISAGSVVLAGVRDLDPDERILLERSEATVIGASVLETLVAVKNALDGAPVYVHLDVDVLDPEGAPVQDPVQGGLAADKLYDVLEAVVEDSELVGFEVTAFDMPDDAAERDGAADLVMHVIEPLLAAVPEEAHVHD